MRAKWKKKRMRRLKRKRRKMRQRSKRPDKLEDVENLVDKPRQVLISKCGFGLKSDLFRRC